MELTWSREGYVLEVDEMIDAIHGMIVQGMHEYNHYGPASVGAPGKKETKLCRLLGKRVAELASQLKG